MEKKQQQNKTLKVSNKIQKDYPGWDLHTSSCRVDFPHLGYFGRKKKKKTVKWLADCKNNNRSIAFTL